MWYIHIMEYYFNIVLLHAPRSKNLENIMLSERSYILYDSFHKKVPKETNQQRTKVMVARGWSGGGREQGVTAMDMGFLLG